MAITANAPGTADNTVWHALPADDVVKRLATSVDQGLNAGIIFGVVLLNVLLGFIQEGKAEKAVFGNEAIPLHVWPVLFAGGLAFFLVVEAVRQGRR